MTTTIPGPLGPFHLPSDNDRTRAHCEALSRAVFDGEYAHGELPADVRTVLDIGAGWGAFTTWALTRWPNIVIDAYEPHREAADVWIQNVEAPNRVGIARIHRAAVTSEPAPKLNGCEDWGSYTLAPPDDTCAWPVPGVHPADLPPCDVLKIDAEGSEVDILSNYPPNYLAYCKALLVEFHSSEKRRQVREIVEAAGFRCVREEPEPATFGVMVWVKP